jgi:S-(hydroxymethyl)glutathione dehydrogenase/alcohol dehydrogenase
VKTTAAITTSFHTPFELMEFELREIGPREVLVRIDTAAVCVTDVAVQDGGAFSKPPFVTGHAGTGVVHEIGDAVSKVKVGDRVVIVGTTECGECFFCLNGSPGACVEVFESFDVARTLGESSLGEIIAEAGIGIYSQWNIYREGTVVAIPDTLPLEHACLLGCGITSGLGAVLNVADVTAGSSVSISGAGHLGLWMTQAAHRLAGAAKVIVVDPIKERRELALQLGATDVVDPADGDPVEQVKALTVKNRGVDFAFEAAGSSIAMEQAFRMARNGGTIVPTGLDFGRDVNLTALEFSILSKKVVGSQTGGGAIHRDVPRFARLLAEGRIDAVPIVTKVFPLSGINDALDAARNKTVITGVIDLNL